MFSRSLSQATHGQLKCSTTTEKESQPLDLSFLDSKQRPSIDQIKDEADQTWLARIILITVSAFYGTNFGCVKIVDEALDPSVAASLRFSLAAVVFLPFLLKSGFKVPKLVIGGLEVGSYCAVGYFAQAQALETASASTVAFLCSLAVITVPLLDILFAPKSKENKPGSWLISLLPAALAATGVGCLELGGSSLPGVGDVWALVQPIAFGLGFWKTESYMKESKDGDAQVFTGAMMLAISVFSILWMSHDFLGPVVGDVSAFQAAVGGQVDAFANDWHVLAAICWTGER